MGAALPIVCTVPGEAWTLIEDADAGVHAEWENPAALADAIGSLVQHSELRTCMGRNGRVAVETVHSIEHSGDLLHSALERIAR
jgi:glycosyltransferase involved in cell wall biosynthesis